MGILSKTSSLRADEIVQYAYEFALGYDREYGDSGAVPAGVVRPGQLNRILVDKALNVIQNCSIEDANRVAITTEKIINKMELDIKVAMDATSEELNKEISATDPQRSVQQGGDNFGGGWDNDEPDKQYNYPLGSKGTEPESNHFGAGIPNELYHVTYTDRVAKIKSQGILPMQTTNWVRQGDGKRYGEGDVFAFTDLIDAIRWAGKMDWDFNKSMGTGKISIVKFAPNKSNKWKKDIADPLSQASSNGSWLKMPGKVEPSQIVSVTPVTQDLIKSVTQGKPVKLGFISALLRTAKAKCPHCGSSEYGLMPTDFETAKCHECGKNWEMGLVKGVNASAKTAIKGTGIRGDEAVNFYAPTKTLAPRMDLRTHIDKNEVDNPVLDDRKADKKKMEGPAPATGHAPLRENLAERSFMASKVDDYILNLIDDKQEFAKQRFLESTDVKQIAQDNGWSMEQAWHEVGRNFTNELYDPRNRLVE